MTEGVSQPEYEIPPGEGEAWLEVRKQLAAAVEEHRAFLQKVREFAITIRRQGRATYCYAGLNEFLQKYKMPLTREYENNPDDDNPRMKAFRQVEVRLMPTGVTLAPEDFSTAGLKKILTSRRQSFARQRNGIRDYSHQVHSQGYYDWQVRDEFLQLIGEQPVGASAVVSFSWRGHVPAGSRTGTVIEGEVRTLLEGFLAEITGKTPAEIRRTENVQLGVHIPR